MPSFDKTPTFNLKAVVQETGLKPDTLRAWERRYDLPQPARTSGGHRLYSQRDIEILKWLVDRQEEGLSISRAVDLWNQLVAEGKEPFSEAGTEGEVIAPAPLEVGDTLTQLRNSWIEACLAFDEQRAEYTLAQTFALYPPETGCFEVLQKGLSEIGDRWYEGEVTPQQEHFASALAMRRLEALLSINPRPTRGARILVGCPPQEEHTFSALLLTLLLRRRGFDTIYLGADVPVERLEATIQRSRPDLVVLTAQTLPTAATMRAMADLLQEQGVPLAFGGLVFNVAPSLQERIPGHFAGERLDLAVQAVEQLATNPVPSPAAAAVSSSYQQALHHFRQRQARIETTIWENASELAIPQVDLARANRNLAQGIIAALLLGDIELLGHDLVWVEGLIANIHYRMPADVLPSYMRLYYEAAADHLDEPGSLIVAWLRRVAANDHANQN